MVLCASLNILTYSTVSRKPLSIVGAGADPGGGHGGPMPPPFGTEQALNAEVYRALSACSYYDTAHISL